MDIIKIQHYTRVIHLYCTHYSGESRVNKELSLILILNCEQYVLGLRWNLYCKMCNLNWTHYHTNWILLVNVCMSLKMKCNILKNNCTLGSSMNKLHPLQTNPYMHHIASRSHSLLHRSQEGHNHPF